MNSYTIRDIPEDAWQRFQERARRDGWAFHDAVRQLLIDYAYERITPSGSPPPDPVAEKYRPIFGATFDTLAAAADWSTLTDRERGQRLRQAMKAIDDAAGKPSRFAPDFDFTLVAKRLGSRK